MGDLRSNATFRRLLQAFPVRVSLPERGTASQHFHQAFCAGGVAVLLDQQAISPWQHTTFHGWSNTATALAGGGVTRQRRWLPWPRTRRPTSRWPFGRLDGPPTGKWVNWRAAVGWVPLGRILP